VVAVTGVLAGCELLDWPGAATGRSDRDRAERRLARAERRLVRA